MSSSKLHSNLSFYVTLLVFIFEWSVGICASHSSPFPQCCAYPVESFILRDFWGPCGAQTLHQKWRRFVDWVEMNGGWVHPDIVLDHLTNYHPIARGDGSSRSLPSYEKGIFVNIDGETSNKTDGPLSLWRDLKQVEPAMIQIDGLDTTVARTRGDGWRHGHRVRTKMASNLKTGGSTKRAYLDIGGVRQSSRAWPRGQSTKKRVRS